MGVNCSCAADELELKHKACPSPNSAQLWGWLQTRDVVHAQELKEIAENAESVKQDSDEAAAGSIFIFLEIISILTCRPDARNLYLAEFGEVLKALREIHFANAQPVLNDSGSKARATSKVGRS